MARALFHGHVSSCSRWLLGERESLVPSPSCCPLLTPALGVVGLHSNLLQDAATLLLAAASLPV